MVFIVITNLDKHIVNRGDISYCKLGQRLLQIGAAIANQGNYYKLVQLHYEQNTSLCNVNKKDIRTNIETAVSISILNFA